MTEKTLIMALEGEVLPSTMGLSGRGKSQINDIAKQMVDNGVIPEVIVHANIRRSRESAERFRDIFKEALGKDIPLVEERTLSGIDARSEVVNRFNDKFNSVLAVSSPETMARLSDYFCAGSELRSAFNEAGKHKRAAASVLTTNAPTWKESTKATSRKTFKSQI